MGWEVVEVLCVIDVSPYQVRARRPGFEALKRVELAHRPGSRGSAPPALFHRTGGGE
jgi:hypothetical protein